VIVQVLRTGLLSLFAGFLFQFLQDWVASQYLNEFLRGNLINIQIALLAVNSATMGIVLTKIRELIEKHGHGDVFQQTRCQFLLSVKEQVALIGGSIILLTVSQSAYLKNVPHIALFFGSAITGVFVYSMHILYDIAKGVLIIIDYKVDSNSS
jgi:hypothetical protein